MKQLKTILFDGNYETQFQAKMSGNELEMLSVTLREYAANLTPQDARDLVTWLQNEVLGTPALTGLKQDPATPDKPEEKQLDLPLGNDTLSTRKAVRKIDSPITASDQLVVEDLSHKLKGNLTQVRIPK